MESSILKNNKTLFSCLKQLEFIYYLETHLDKKQNTKLLENLNKIRKETQLNTIASIDIYKNQ